MIVLCVGVLLAGYTRAVTADPIYGEGSGSYAVNASVPGPPPSATATITTPKNGEQFSASPITVSGTCPQDTYVSVERNSLPSGVVLCRPEGTFTLKVDLFPGSNELQARVYSYTDVEGPESAPVTVSYQPPAPISPDQGGQAPGQPIGGTAKPQANTSQPVYVGAPLLLRTNFAYRGFYAGEEGEWSFIVEGGESPYAISIDWGDGTQSLVSRPEAGPFKISHTYARSGGYRGSYEVKLTASDASGRQAYLQTVAIISEKPVSGGGITSKPPAGPLGGLDIPNPLLKVIWPSYAIVVLMLASFWLGERREYHLLKPRLKHVHHA